MRSSSLILASLVACSACGDDLAGGSPCVEASGRVLPTRPGELTESSAPKIAGDKLLVGLGETPRTVVAVDLCGGDAPEQLAGAEEGLSGAFTLAGPEGLLAVGQRLETNELVLLDRLDVPGVDIPRPMVTLPKSDSVSALLGDALVLCSGDGCQSAVELTSRVAGRGLPNLDLMIYPGPEGLEAPPVELARGLVWHEWVTVGPVSLYGLSESGDLLKLAGEGEDGAGILQTGVRFASLPRGGDQLLWQAQGDGQNEPVFLRTLATGVDVSLGVNDFTAVSWDPDLSSPMSDTGTWIWTDTAVALIGVEGTLVRAHARTDGALLAPPPAHDRYPYRNIQSHNLFFLTVETGSERAHLAWDPLAGTTHEWLRTASDDVLPIDVTAGVLYGRIDRDTGEGAWMLDRLAGGPAEVLLSGIGPNGFEFPAGQWILSLKGKTQGTVDLHRFDPVTGDHSLLAESATYWRPADGTRLVYTIVDGPDAGVWVESI